MAYKKRWVRYENASELLFISWNDETNEVILIRQTDDQYVVDFMDGSSFEIRRTILLDIPKKKYLIFDLVYNHITEQIIVVFGVELCFFDLQGKLIRQINREDGIVGADFFKNGDLYLELHEFSGCRSFGVINRDGTIDRYPLETTSYNRSFVVHPSEELILSTWNDHACGVYIQVRDTNIARMVFIEEDHLNAERDRYEATGISMNAVGDHFAFLAEDGYDKSHMLYVYSIYDQREPVKEIKLFNRKSIQFFEKSHFFGDNHILAIGRDRLGLIDYTKQRRFKKYYKDDDFPVAVNTKTGQLIYRWANQLYTINVPLVPEENLQQRSDRMKNFLNDIHQGKYQLTPVEEEYY